jgi:hypothetical protein
MKEIKCELVEIINPVLKDELRMNIIDVENIQSFELYLHARNELHNRLKDELFWELGYELQEI